MKKIIKKANWNKNHENDSVFGNPKNLMTWSSEHLLLLDSAFIEPIKLLLILPSLSAVVTVIVAWISLTNR